MFRRFGLAAGLATVLALGLSVLPGTAGATTMERGALVSAEHLRTLTAAEVSATLASDRWDPSLVQYGVDTYRLVYRTIDPHGRPITASGLLALPRNHERRLHAVSFTHGTELFRGDAPSVARDVWGSAPALTYASAGFAAVAPDYLGLGAGPGLHPWKHVPSETSASLDMLRAARGFVPRTGRALTGDVLVTGFSQGASAALGLARALQERADRQFRLVAAAPISGAYDFAGVELPALLDGELHPKASVIYTALLLVSWNRLHHLYDSPRDVFKAPYHRTIEGLFNGEHTGEQVVAGTPDTLRRLLTRDGFELLRHPTGRFAEALRVDVSVCTDWTPAVPVRLYRVSDDVEAAVANSDSCQAGFRARGVEVPIVELGTGGHIESNRLGTAQVVRWFSELR
jgi:hypothetical protein